jgi:S-ribosylhomocysteine lyase LuxS involved in autoinducer biosynthesis
VTSEWSNRIASISPMSQHTGFYSTYLAVYLTDLMTILTEIAGQVKSG